MVDLLVEAFSRLLSMPDMGRAREELRPGMRSYPVYPYLIFYRVTPTYVEVLRVIHGSRDLPALFERETIETFRESDEP
jgi:toxin ParE1/3/4